MDVGSIISNALGGLIGGLALLLLVQVGKRLRRAIKHHTVTPKEVLDKTLLTSQEYQQILSGRKSYRKIGYTCLILLLIFLTEIIAISMYTRTVNVSIEWIVFLLLLLCEVPLAFYRGYSPITSQEVEHKRQVNRQRTLKEARGARPYGYILQSIIFPLLGWLFLFCNLFGLILILAFPPSLVHIPLMWVTLGIGFAIVAGVYGTYMLARWLYMGVKNLNKVPKLRQSELRRQFTQDEFRQ